jgi:hypothetical protein
MEKFITYEFQVFAPIRVGLLEGYAFLDTGASSSRIYQSFSDNLSRDGETQLQGALGTSQVQQCKLERVNFLGHDFLDMAVRIQPDEVGGFQSLPFPVVMTVGADILYQKVFHFECAAGRVGFLESVSPELESQSKVIDLHFEKRFAFFKVNMGRHVLNAAFDAGAGYCVLNARCLDALRADLVEQSPEETSDSTGAKSLIPVYKHPALEINGYCLGETRFLVMDLTAVEEALDMAVDFIFGFNAMSNHNWIVDKLNHRLLLH